jgi:hypothetical protein
MRIFSLFTAVLVLGFTPIAGLAQHEEITVANQPSAEDMQ